MIRIYKNLLVVYNKKNIEYLNPNPKLLGLRKKEKVPKMDKLYSKKKETPRWFDSGHHVKRIFHICPHSRPLFIYIYIYIYI